MTLMFNILKQNIVLLFLIGLCFILAACCQLFIPYLLSRAISNITNTGNTISLLQTLALVFIGKGLAQGVANSLNTYLESTLRIDLIKHIYKNFKNTSHGSLMTLIKEDAERVASAISNTLYLFGSSILVIFTFYLLIIETPYFCAPLIIIWTLTTRHIKRSSKIVATNYQIEITREEAYKSSVLTLMNPPTSNPINDNDNLKKNNHHLNEAITARYQYEKLNLKLCFIPEFIIAVSTALIIIFIATMSPELFGSKYIYYLGYLGIFSMACRHSLETALSLVGVNESIKRIFKGENHE